MPYRNDSTLLLMERLRADLLASSEHSLHRRNLLYLCVRCHWINFHYSSTVTPYLKCSDKALFPVQTRLVYMREPCLLFGPDLFTHLFYYSERWIIPLSNLTYSCPLDTLTDCVFLLMDILLLWFTVFCLRSFSLNGNMCQLYEERHLLRRHYGWFVFLV